jgi:hypothetical protein
MLDKAYRNAEYPLQMNIRPGAPACSGTVLVVAEATVAQ